MRATMSFFAVLTTAIVLTLLVVLFVTESRTLYWMSITGIWLTWLLFCSFSFYVLKPDERLVAMFFATFDATYVSGSDYEELQQRYAGSPHEAEFRRYCRRGPLSALGLPDIVYLQFPFFYDVRPATTGSIRIHVKATDGAFTAKLETVHVIPKVSRITHEANGQTSSAPVNPQQVGKRSRVYINPVRPIVAPPAESTWQNLAQGRRAQTLVTYHLERRAYPAVEMEIDVDVVLNLGVHFGPLIRKLPRATLNDPKKLAEEILALGEPVIQEAIIRSVHEFTWEGPQDVLSRQPELEAEIIRRLRVHHTFFVEAGLLNELAHHTHHEAMNGVSVTSIDIAMERPIPKSAALRDAIGLAAKATYERDALRERMMGTTLGLADRQAATGLAPEVIFAHDALVTSNQLFVLGAPDAVSALGAIFRGGRGGGSRQNRQQPQPPKPNPPNTQNP